MTASTDRRKSALWIDALVLLAVASLFAGLIQVGREWQQPLRQTVEIDLSPTALPVYAVYSLARGWIAYAVSLLFTLTIASWAFYNERARRFILPTLDILQSLPVLSFLPGLVMALVGIFPHSNIGLELACVLMIFTGQVWNMTFSYYDSLRGLPGDFRAIGRLYGFSWWRRFWKIELPAGAQGLLYNSMVSMAGGWFFLSINEAFRLGDQDYRLPGIGSYMSVAIEHGNVHAQIYGVIAMAVVIVSVDRLIWWPLIVWSRKFKLDDFAGAQSEVSSLQRWLDRSKAFQALQLQASKIARVLLGAPKPVSLSRAEALKPSSPWAVWSYRFVVALIVGVFAIGLYGVARLLIQVSLGEWARILGNAGITFGRVLVAVALGTLWTVPFGVWVGLNQNLSKKLQPVIQFAASFPAPMIYPWVLGVVIAAGGSLQWGAIPLIMMGTQWYILFNVTAAAAAIPQDLLSAAELLHLKGWRRWKKFILPAIFPGLVTGWITAAGGAWNATIVSEYVRVGKTLHEATGLGAYISQATDAGNFPELTAAALVMAIFVVGVNLSLWKKLQVIAQERCRFLT